MAAGVRQTVFAAAALLALGGCGGAESPEPAGGAGGAEQGGAPAGGSDQGGAGPVSPGALIMSFNIETFPKHTSTAGKVVAIVESLAPAVMAVVEIDDTVAFDGVLADLPGYEAVLNDDPGAFTHVGLIYDPSRVSLGNVETLFKDNTNAFPRPPLSAAINLTLDDGSSFTFVAIVLHLKAQIDSASEARRREAVLALDDYVREQVALGVEDDFVLLGDFNDKIDDPAPYNVFPPFLDAPDTYTFLTTAEARSGDFSYIPFSALIDHMLVTNGALPELGGATANVFHLEDEISDYEATVSDHLPVGVYAIGTGAR